MLSIRLQRLGKAHYATYRVVVQDVRRHPSSGKVVARVGSYNPHTKAVQLDKPAIDQYLLHGAQPTDRMVKILTSQGVQLPKWVKIGSTDHKRAVRNQTKLRKNQAKADKTTNTAEPAEQPAETVAQ